VELTCEDLEALLPEMMDGQLGLETEEKAVTHLATCDSCRVIVDGVNRVRAAAREHGRATMPEEARARIRKMIQSEERPTPQDG
jgi:predicted anti-sigma-YlaC factor YlaD